MKLFIYDKNGLGFSELCYLSLNFPLLHAVIVSLIAHNCQKVAIFITRLVV